MSDGGEKEKISLRLTVKFTSLDKLIQLWSNQNAVEYLLNSNIPDRNTKGETILHILIRFNRTSVLIKVIDKFLNILNEVNKQGNTPFLIAARNGNIKAVTALKEKGADISLRTKNNKSALYLAVEQNNINLVQILVSWRVHLNTQAGVAGYTPLILAIRKQFIDIANYLLDHRAMVNIQCNEGRTALWYAVLDGQLNNVKKLLKLNSDVNIRDINGMTPLMVASKRGHPDIIKLLLLSGANFNARCKNHRTALWYALLNGELTCIEELLKLNFDVNIQDIDGMTLLMAASKFYHPNIFKLLLSEADINVQCRNQRTALWYAVLHGDLNCVEELLKRNSDVNTNDIDAITPLMVASKFNHPKIIKLLLLSGADVNAQCKNNRTALHYAAFNGNFKCIKKLLKARPKRNVKDINGKTALMAAALYDCNEEIVPYLLYHNCKPNIQCKIGRSALHYAASKGYHLSCRFLIEAGATVDLKDNRGITPFILAAIKGYANVVKYLKEAEADINMTDNNGKTALICLTSNADTVNKYIPSGSGVCTDKRSDIEGKDGNAKLSIINVKEVISYLISLNININARCNRGLTALHYAALRGYKTGVINLLEAKVAINSTDKRGETPLHKAASRGHSKIIIILLRHGAVESKMCVRKKAPYELACMGNHINSMWLFKDAIYEKDNKYPLVLLKTKKGIKLTQEEQLHIMENIVDALRKNRNASSVQLKSVEFCNGELLFTTFDQVSREWLVRHTKKNPSLKAVKLDSN